MVSFNSFTRFPVLFYVLSHKIQSQIVNSLFSFLFSSSTIIFPFANFPFIFSQTRSSSWCPILLYSFPFLLSVYILPSPWQLMSPVSFPFSHGFLFFSSSFFLLSFFSFYVLSLTLMYTLFCCTTFCLFRCFSLYHFSSSFFHIPLSVSGFRLLGTTRWTTARLSQR